MQFSDIAQNYGPIADANPDRVSAKLKEIIAEGRTFSAADYAAARAEQEQLYEALRPILANHDAILTPAATGPALVGLGGTGSPMFNALWTYLGMPCISLPLLEVEGLPVGVQLVGARGSDAGLLRVANWLMQEHPSHHVTITTAVSSLQARIPLFGHTMHGRVKPGMMDGGASCHPAERRDPDPGPHAMSL